MKFEKIKLPYSYDKLEPYIDSLTVETHYEKHHTAYQNTFDAAIVGTPIYEFETLEEVLLNYSSIQEDKKAAVRNAGGGLWNHNFYWEQFIVDREMTEDELDYLEKIKSQFETLEKFKEEFVKVGLSVFGSGWVWLVEKDNELKIMTTPNQENPLMQGIENIVIGIDVWEHAYYLKYKQNRKEYIENTLKLTLVK